MAASVIGLCLLVLGTSGLVKTGQYFEYDDIIRHPWNVRFKHSKLIPHFNWNFGRFNHLSKLGPLNFRNNPRDYEDKSDELDYYYEDVDKFDNRDISKPHNAALHSTLSGLKLSSNGVSIIAETDSSALSASSMHVRNNIGEDRISDVHSPEKSGENDIPETRTKNYISPNTGSHTPSKISPLLDSEQNLPSADIQYVTDLYMSFESEHNTTSSADISSQKTSQKTMHTSEIRENNSVNLNPESNSLPSEKTKVASTPNSYPTRNESANTDGLPTEESSLIGNEESETTSIADNGEISFHDYKTLSTQETSAATASKIPTENPSPTYSSSDNSISQTAAVPGEKQTKSSIPLYSGDEGMQVTTTQTTIYSMSETSDSITSTIGKDLPVSLSTTTRNEAISSKTETSNSISSTTERDLPASITSTTTRDFPASITSTTTRDFPASLSTATANEAISSKIETSNSISSTTEKDFPVSSSTAKDGAKTDISSTPVKYISVSLSTSTGEAILSTTEVNYIKSERITESITQDHTIRISSIRTVRVAISVMFIAIALIAAAVLAIYMFRVKRRQVQYDQLMLLP